MSNIAAARQLVLARLGAPAPLLPGERYRYRSPRLDEVYRRFDRFVVDELMRQRPEALAEFIADLEIERERDYDGFMYGRELLLDNLESPVELPGSDPEPDDLAPRDPARRMLPRWSRRKPAWANPKRLRALTLERLGRPHPRLPGEYYVFTGSHDFAEIRGLIDELEYTPLGEAVIVDAIARIAPLRERDWDAFCFGRIELLELLPVELDPPRPSPTLAVG